MRLSYDTLPGPPFEVWTARNDRPASRALLEVPMSQPSVNLLPAALRRRLTIRRGLRQWAVGWSVVGLFALGCWGVVWSETRQLRADVVKAELSCGGVCRMQTIGRGYDQQIKSLTAKKNELKAMADNSAGLKTLAVVSAAAKVTGSGVVVDEYVYRESVVNTGSDQTGALRRVDLDIAGVAESDRAVGRFVAQLQKTEVFESVILQSIRGAGGAGLSAGRRVFRLKCTLFIAKAQEATVL